MLTSDHKRKISCLQALLMDNPEKVSKHCQGPPNPSSKMDEDAITRRLLNLLCLISHKRNRDFAIQYVRFID